LSPTSHRMGETRPLQKKKKRVGGEGNTITTDDHRISAIKFALVSRKGTTKSDYLSRGQFKTNLKRLNQEFREIPSVS